MKGKIILTLFVLFILLWLFLPALLKKMSNKLINMPHREYWLARPKSP